MPSYSRGNQGVANSRIELPRPFISVGRLNPVDRASIYRVRLPDSIEFSEALQKTANVYFIHQNPPNGT